jgi:hypothetical protein
MADALFIGNLKRAHSQAAVSSISVFKHGSKTGGSRSHNMESRPRSALWPLNDPRK